MNQKLNEAYQAELELARAAYHPRAGKCHPRASKCHPRANKCHPRANKCHPREGGDPIAQAFHHLERAHILGQRDTWAHVRTHWLMLRLGASTDQWREVAGQAIRIVAAALFSRIWVPVGNTGRAHVSAMKPMPIPEDLRRLMGSGSESWR